jgi:hypothetical protein
MPILPQRAHSPKYEKDAHVRGRLVYDAPMKHIIALGFALSLALSGCGGAGTTQTITGTFTVKGYFPNSFPGSCDLGSGYQDIEAGASVTVKDGAGSIIGVSNLESPTTANKFECVLPFSVTVSDSEFYSIEVSRRGEVTYSRADLESQGWTVGLTLGN